MFCTLHTLRLSHGHEIILHVSKHSVDSNNGLSSSINFKDKLWRLHLISFKTKSYMPNEELVWLNLEVLILKLSLSGENHFITGFVIFLQTDQNGTTDYGLLSRKRNSLLSLSHCLSHLHTHIIFPEQN